MIIFIKEEYDILTFERNESVCTNSRTKFFTYKKLAKMAYIIALCVSCIS